MTTWKALSTYLTDQAKRWSLIKHKPVRVGQVYYCRKLVKKINGPLRLYRSCLHQAAQKRIKDNAARKLLSAMKLVSPFLSLSLRSFRPSDSLCPILSLSLACSLFLSLPGSTSRFPLAFWVHRPRVLAVQGLLASGFSEQAVEVGSPSREKMAFFAAGVLRSIFFGFLCAPPNSLFCSRASGFWVLSSNDGGGFSPSGE